jgi:iduronate 2-sulfatase
MLLVVAICTTLLGASTSASTGSSAGGGISGGTAAVSPPSSESCPHGSTAGGNYLGPAIPNNQPRALNATACALACVAERACVAWVHHIPACSGHGESCTLASGCCWLKRCVARFAQNPCNCGQRMTGRNASCAAPSPAPPDAPPVPGGPPPPPGPPCAAPAATEAPAPPNARPVLYLLVDDLRPELPPWGSTHVHAPHISKLAATGTVFTHSYCQQAVCSPSRMSFLTGRRPARTRTVNFLDHFRQAWCGVPVAGRAYGGAVLRNVSLAPRRCRERFGSTCGGAGECCTLCTAEPQCGAWTYVPATGQGPMCTLFHDGNLPADLTVAGALSGASGVWDTANWTSLPQHFLKAGYFVLGTGKVFHDGTGGVHAPWRGPGMPPLNDPPSWTPGCSMQDADSDAYMWPCSTPVGAGRAHGCAINATEGGEVGLGEKPLADKVVADEAVAKLRLAAAHFLTTGRPFMLVAGMRKPHMDWRFPKPFLDYYPNASQIKIAAHPTMDRSIPPIAHRGPCLQSSPYAAMEAKLAQTNRLYYYSAISWVDSQIGRTASASSVSRPESWMD